MNERLRKLKQDPRGLVIWLALVCGSYLLLGSAAYQAQSGFLQRLPWAILSLIVVLIGHELLHALAARILCRGKVRIELAKDPLGLPALRTVFPADVSRGRLLVIYLTPLMMLTVIPTLFITLMQPVFFLFLAAMINAVGAYFDLIDTAMLLTSQCS